MKSLLIIFGVLTFSFLLLLGGCLGLNKHIFGNNDCENFNIDNIEVRTGINVPKVLDATQCQYDEVAGTKHSVFFIDKDVVDLESYAVSNNLQLDARLYSATGDNEKTKWSASLNPDSGELVFDLEYK